MSRCMIRAMLKWVTCLAIVGCAFVNQTAAKQSEAPLHPIQFKTLYVEALSVKTSSEKLRSDMIAQLRGSLKSPLGESAYQSSYF
jgi:hypothetical protein